MALIQKLNPSDLYHLACKIGRDKNFGHDGWRAIGDYLESLSDDTGEDVEVDIVAICCDYAMAESADDFAEQYQQFMDSIDPEDWGDMSEDDKLAAVSDYLQENTALVICEDDLIIWQAF